MKKAEAEPPAPPYPHPKASTEPPSFRVLGFVHIHTHMQWVLRIHSCRLNIQCSKHILQSEKAACNVPRSRIHGNKLNPFYIQIYSTGINKRRGGSFAVQPPVPLLNVKARNCKNSHNVNVLFLSSKVFLFSYKS